MRSHENFLKVALTLLCLQFMDCANTRTPKEWLTEPEQVPTDAFGAWINLETTSGYHGGELIAIMNDSLYVADSVTRALAFSDIHSARLVTYDANNPMAFGTFLGTLLTVTNGAFLLLTAPMWLIGGPIATVSRSYDPIIDYPSRPLKEFVPFARYPQGLPPGLDRQEIRMKVYH